MHLPCQKSNATAFLSQLIANKQFIILKAWMGCMERIQLIYLLKPGALHHKISFPVSFLIRAICHLHKKNIRLSRKICSVALNYKTE
jgi:hypothetical protein